MRKINYKFLILGAVATLLEFLDYFIRTTAELPSIVNTLGMIFQDLLTYGAIVFFALFFYSLFRDRLGNKYLIALCVTLASAYSFNILVTFFSSITEEYFYFNALYFLINIVNYPITMLTSVFNIGRYLSYFTKNGFYVSYVWFIIDSIIRSIILIVIFVIVLKACKDVVPRDRTRRLFSFIKTNNNSKDAVRNSDTAFKQPNSSMGWFERTFYSGIGSKIKKFARICGVIDFICGIILSFASLFEGEYLYFIIGLACMFAPIILTWPLYAFGEITECLQVQRYGKKAADNNNVDVDNEQEEALRF